MRVALSRIVSKTGFNSPGEELMTLSTSDVAVCCSNDSERLSVRWRNSLSRRVFSMAITAWAAKFLTSLICLLVKGRILAIDSDHTNQHIALEHRHIQMRPCAS